MISMQDGQTTNNYDKKIAQVMLLVVILLNIYNNYLGYQLATKFKNYHSLYKEQCQDCAYLKLQM